MDRHVSKFRTAIIVLQVSIQRKATTFHFQLMTSLIRLPQRTLWQIRPPLQLSWRLCNIAAKFYKLLYFIWHFRFLMLIAVWL